MRIVTPSEIAFRISENLRFLHERMSGEPEPRLAVGPRDFLPELLFDVFRDREAACAFVGERYPESVRRTISLAGGILQNRIPIFSDVVDCGARIDWHREYATGIRSPAKFYRDIDFLDPEIAGDKKLIWELNRHNFFVILGKAFWLTGDRAYYEKWRDLLLSWIEANRYNRGINWASSIELAIRCVNWIWSSCFFREELEKDPVLQERMLRAVYAQAIHIERHLSYFFSPNTHLTGEALGLLYIGRSYPVIASSPKWVSLAEGILEAELPRQILNDGGYFEMATYYHKYTVDFYLHYLLLSGGARARKPETVERIRKAIEHLALLSEPDGTIPLLGDSDGGQLLFLTMDKNSIAGACSTGATLLNDGKLKHLCGGRFHEESLWLLGPAAAKRFEEIPSVPLQSYHSINRDTGFYCFRTGMTPRDSFVLVDCGPHGWKVCGHAHSDLLSFEWYCNGTKVITDPGTCTYTGSSADRDRCRSSQVHNTITIDDVSQSIPKAPFRWKKIARPKAIFAKTCGDMGYFEGEHDAYENIGCLHRRMVLFLGSDLAVVIDLVETKRAHPSILYGLQFGEGSVRALGAGCFEHARAGRDRSGWVRIFNTARAAAVVRDGEVYPDYNAAAKAPKLEVGFRADGRLHAVVTALCRERELAESLAVRGNAAEGIALFGASRESRCAIAARHLGGAGASDGSLRCALSAFAESKGKTMFLLRNERTARDDRGDRFFESAKAEHCVLGIVESGAMAVCSDEIPSIEYVPEEVRSVEINGSPHSISRKCGTIV